MGKTDLVRLRKHSMKKTSDVAFWCVLLVGISKRHIKIALRIVRAFQIIVSSEKVSIVLLIAYLCQKKSIGYDQ